MDNFSSILKKLRKNIGLTQDELAEKLGVRKTTISNYETGYSSPTKDTLVQLATLFNVSMDQLLGRVSSSLSESSFPIHSASLKEMKTIPAFASLKKETMFSETNIIDYIDLSAEYIGNGEFFGLKVDGNQMSGSRLFDGDYAIVRKQNFADGGDVAVVCINGEPAIMRHFFITDNQISLLANRAGPVDAALHLQPCRLRYYDIGKGCEITDIAKMKLDN